MDTDKVSVSVMEGIQSFFTLVLKQTNKKILMVFQQHSNRSNDEISVLSVQMFSVIKALRGSGID